MIKNLRGSLTLIIVALLFSAGLINAQQWKDPMADNTLNFYQLQQQFNHDMRELMRQQSRNQQQTQQSSKSGSSQAEEESEEGAKGYRQFKRWEYFMEPRVYPSGDLSLPSTNWQRFQDYLNNNPAAMQQYQYGQGNVAARIGGPNNTIQSSTWTFAGPTGAPTGAGAGRINFIRMDPTNPNTIWVGAPAGGLWKSTNGGASWTTNTDLLTVIGASDVVIDPTNTQNMYLATGDGDAGDTYSIGVLKSTDGGTTWNTTGMVWTPNQGRVIRKLLINPTTPTTIMAFTNVGIWRTTNGGTTWAQIITNGTYDAEFKPGDPNTVYACGTSFFKSTNGGATWTTITTGLPAAGNVNRLAIAVTAANTGYVYMVAGSAATSGFYGFYRSTNSGTSFTQVTVSSPANLLGWSSTGNDAASGGQSWYDLAIDASPTNANEVCVGGVNIWRTTNGGTSWTINGHWTGTGAPYVHADHHALLYTSGTTVFEGGDGGVFKTTNNGATWIDISANLCIAQIYRIGQSASNASLWITGHQDNGTNLKNGAAYVGTMGGDGMDCFIDRTNNNVMYGSQYNGSLNRSTNGGGTWSGINSGLTGNAPWVTAWYQSPTTANTLYCGRTNLFRSTNQGTTWSAVASAVPGTGTIVDFKIAPSNNQVIYVVKSGAVYKTVNAGGAWTTITGTLPVASAFISRVDVKPTDPNTAIVTFSGYSNNNKVFKTTNGGTSWTNISAGLPNLPCNCVRFDASSSIDGVYVGCDVGVYYMDNTFTSWQPYFTSLPNVPVFDLEVYTPTGKLRAASYGRGVWEVDVYNPGTLPPIAQFSASSYITCVGAPVNFTDLSSFTPTAWTYTFPGGAPATATTQNPAGVTWSAPGTYTVTLTCSNTNGTSAPATQVITVLGSQTPPLVEGFQAVTFVPTGWTANNINNDGLYWNRATVGAASTNSARFDNYNMDVAGAIDEMWAPRLDCSSFSTLSMTFDVAYARYNATYSDSLEVRVSTNCGATWTTVYLKGGTNTAGNLATAPDQQATIFTPTAAQWRNETVSLNAYAGQGSVLIVFRNRGHYGQALYVDNINITGTASAVPNATFTASATTACAGTPINFTDGSSSSPTSWTWTFPGGTPPSATTQNVTGVVWNTAGTYTVTHTATNVSGTGTTTQIITITALPTITTTTTGATICSGNTTGMTASGGVTYNWMPGNLTGTTVTVSPATTTTYTVTGTNAAGCTNTATRTITVTPLPTVTITATNTTICTGNSTTLTASGATTYLWMPGSLTGTSVTVSPTTTTTYTVTGTTSGCTGTATRLITVTPSPTVSTTTTGGTICSGNSTTITASGATTYLWMPGSLTGTTVTVSPTTTTTYTVTGTTGGCSSTATRTITVNPSPTVSTTVTPGGTICSGNSKTITASGASTYTWMPGNLTGNPVTVFPATTTTYTVTGTATNGCTGTATRTINVNPTPTVTATASSTSICAGNTVTLTGSGATTYNWMPGNVNGAVITRTPTVTTTYTVTGTTSGCSSTATITIVVGTSPAVTASAANPSICIGNNTTLTGSGASTYTWMPGNLSGTTVTVSPTTTTTYTVTGSAGPGCTNTATLTVTVDPIPTISTTTTAGTICDGSSTTITASGASTYTWMPGSLTGTTVTVSPSVATTYTVTGTSGAGCTNTATELITVNPSPTVTATTTAATICDGSSTTITANGASSYNWMPGNVSGATITVSPSVTTTYTVTGTGANGCTNDAFVSVVVNPLPVVTATASSNAVCTGTMINLTGTGASTYNWQPVNLSGSTVSDTPLSSTTYTVTGTDINGCTNTDTADVVVYSQPTITISGTDTICIGSSTTLTANGGFTYFWPLGGEATAIITDSPVTTTTYTVNGTDASGCSNTATFTVTVGTPPAVPNVIVNGSLLTSSITAASYQWFLNGVPIAGATSQSYTATQMGSFTVEAYDDAGCASGQSPAVLDPTGIAVATNVDAISVIPNPNDGHFQLNFHVTKSDNYVLEISDMLGQVIYSESLLNFKGVYNKDIDLSIYGKGQYLIRLRSSVNETTIKSITY